MTTMTTSTARVNRSFAEGLFDSKVKADARTAQYLLDNSPEKWVASVRLIMLGLNYTADAAAEAVKWMSCPRGRVDRCPSVAREDWAVINAVKAEADRPAFLTDAERAELVAEVDAETPPAVVVRDLPGDDDRQWWAANSPANQRGFRVVGFAPMQTRGTVRCEHADRALGAMHAGLIPPELAEAVMSRSLVGHWCGE